MALSAEILTTVQTGITSADSNFYAIGGTVLVVLAGIWGFRLVKGLMRSDRSSGISSGGPLGRNYPDELYDKHWKG